MNLRALVISIVAVSIALSGCSGNTAASKLLNNPAPKARVTLLDGDLRSIEEFRGKNVILLFWATTCSLSHRTIERLNDFAAKHGRSKNLEIIAVSIDKYEKLQAVRDKIKFLHLNSIIHSYSGNDIYDEAYMMYQVDTLPYMFLIDPSGLIVAASSDDDDVCEYLG